MIQHPQEDKILLVKRKIQDEWFYEPIGGRVEVDFLGKKAETLEECIQRESLEETGVEIQHLQYVGSYYFFWLHHPNTCSICALFFATVKGSFRAFKTVTQEACGATYPVWVSLQDVMVQAIRFNPRHVGLERLIMSRIF
jgi:NADH pyrophosphatase NudC (nudix superfamily)